MTQASGLFTELKRRNVFRVAAAYAVAAWLLIEVADTIFPRLNLPDWTVTFIIVLALLGFPLAVFLAWAYEVTPEGVKRSHDVAPEASTAPKTGKRIDRLILAGALAVIAVMAVERFWFAQRAKPESNAAAAIAEKPSAARSIAVLAFDDLSPEGDQAYFAEGVSEELLNLLARIDGFKVAARTSSFKFRGTQADIGEIGHALNVETVLEGSVRKAGDQIRVTAQLINVADGFHIWSDSYNRQLENIFAVQDEIAAAIVDALKLKLDIGAATAGRTENTEAYDHYLRGRQLAREPTRAGLLRAIEQYEQAIALDPGFAAAYAGIADAWVWLEDYGGVKSAESFPRAEQAARRALELDPESAEAHAAMAFVLDRYHDDKQGARDYFERTLELNPNYVTAYNLYGDTLRDLGEIDRMVEVHRTAVELDPLSVFMKTRLSSKLIGIGRLEEARAILDGVFAEFPDNDFAHEEMANLNRAQVHLAEALGHFRILHFARPGDPYAASQIALIAAGFDDPGLAEAWIAAARARGEDNRWELLARATLARWRGDWMELDRVGGLSGGERGAHLRGMAASHMGSWPEARRHLLESLRLLRFDSGNGAQIQHIGALVELAWVEKRLGLSDWRQRLALIRPVIEPLIAQGVNQLYGDSNFDYLLARVQAIDDQPDAALVSLRAARKTGFIGHWFLERDPVFAAWRDEPGFRALANDMRAQADAEREKLEGQEILP